MREVLIAIPGDIVRGVADVKDAGEQQRQTAAARTNNQVCARKRSGKSQLRGRSQAVDADQKHHRKPDGEDGKRRAEAASAQRFICQPEQGHTAGDSAVPYPPLIAASDSASSKCAASERS